MPDFDPDAYLAKKQAPADDFDPDAYLANKLSGQPAPAVVAPSEPVNVQESFGDFLTSTAGNLPLAGLAGKASDIEGAAIDRLGDIFRKPEDRKDFMQRYEQRQAERAARQAQAEERSPTASTLGTVAGSAGWFLTPTPFAGAGGIGGAAARVGQGMAENYVDALTKGEGFNPEAAADAAGTGGKFQAALETISPMARAGGKVINKIGGKIKEFGNETLIKNAIGANKKQWTKLTSEPLAEDFADTLRTGYEGTKKPVTMFSDSKKSLKRIEEIKGKLWNKIDGVHSQVDQLNPKSVSGDRLADELVNIAASKPSFGENEAIQEYVLKQAEKLQGKSFSLKEMQDIKNSFFYPDIDPRIGVKGPNIMKIAIGNEMKKAVANAPLDDAAKSEYVKNMSLFGDFANVLDPVKRNAGGEMSKMKIGLPEMLVATGAGAGTYGSTEDPLQSVINFGMYGLGAKAARQYGTSALGITARGLGKGIQALPKMQNIGASAAGAAKAAGALKAEPSMSNSSRVDERLEKNPASLGKYAPVLQGAKQKGQDSFGAAHYTLWKNDPEYRKMFENPD